MRFLFIVDHAEYRSKLTGERLGWVAFRSQASFALVHRVEIDPEEGPVILVGDEVYEIDCEDAVYPSDEAAREAYYAKGAAAGEGAQN